MDCYDKIIFLCVENVCSKSTSIVDVSRKLSNYSSIQNCQIRIFIKFSKHLINMDLFLISERGSNLFLIARPLQFSLDYDRDFMEILAKN